MIRNQSDQAECGFAEVVPLVMITVVAGLALILHSVTVVHARGALAGAARDATRAYVESDSGPEARRRAAASGRAAYTEFAEIAPLRLTLVDGVFRRCDRISFEASTRLPYLHLPWSTSPGTRVTVRHTEIVDPYRSGPAGVARCE